MQKFKYKTLGLILLIAALIAMFAGCGGGPMTKPVPLEGVDTYDITASCNLERDGDTFKVTGETNLMDGTILYISLHAQSGMELDAVKITKTQDTISQSFQITEDKYDENVKKVYAYITCAPTLYGNHTDSVYQMYGEDFERVKAEKDNVIWNNDGVILTFASDPIDM